MDTDNPNGPEQSIVDRLNASFAADDAPEAAPEEADDQPQEIIESEATEDAEEPAEQEEASDTVEVEDDDGNTHRIPAALKDAVLRRADYTRKTQQAATLAESAQDRLQYAEAREQFVGAVVQEIAEIRSMQAQLKQYEALDKGALYAQDPATALRVRDQEDALRRQIQEREQAVAQKGKQVEQITQQHYAKQWQIAVEGARQRIGSYTPGEDAAMLKQVEALGFSPNEIKGRYADPRILHAIYKAAKWDTLQAGKNKAVTTAQKAPPVVKPGAITQNAAASKEKALRSQLKKSGDYRDAAKLLLLKGM